MAAVKIPRTPHPETNDDNAKTKLIEDIPLKRLGSFEDISDLVVFLSSEDASYITGQTISVDGGLFMY